MEKLRFLLSSSSFVRNLHTIFNNFRYYWNTISIFIIYRIGLIEFRSFSFSYNFKSFEQLWIVIRIMPFHFLLLQMFYALCILLHDDGLNEFRVYLTMSRVFFFSFFFTRSQDFLHSKLIKSIF